MKELMKILFPYRDRKSICFGTLATLTIIVSQSVLVIPFAFATAYVYKQIKGCEKYKE